MKSENIDKFLGVVTELVNNSIESATFPDCEKNAIIKPILKGNNDPQNLASYRPVSNLTFISKVHEKVILEQLMKHLLSTNIFPDNQSAYRRLYSTETTLCAVMNSLVVNMDKGKCSVLILLDLSAAFDTVDHKLLLQDCNEVGIVGNALEYLKSYLSNRSYKVKIRKSFSSVKINRRGVPQGSVLGPILFCIYTIGLAQILADKGVDFKLYADDTQFYLTLTEVEETEAKLNCIMQEVKRWMNSKKLKLNERKTECLIIGKRSHLRKLNIASFNILDTTMTVKNEAKNLGVIIDENLSFHSQINNTVRVANYHLRNLSFIKKYLDNDYEKTDSQLRNQ